MLYKYSLDNAELLKENQIITKENVHRIYKTK